MGGTTQFIILLVILAVAIAFVIYSSIRGKKASKREKKRRYQEVRNQIKSYIAEIEKKKNLRIEFEKVYARKGAEYKYRDVFDVIVELIEPKTNKITEIRAYEIEGITTKIDKKNFKTDWVVNGTLDLDETKHRIAIAEKEIKLSKEEKRQYKKEERARDKEFKAKERLETKTQKAAAKNKPAITREGNKIERINQNTHKFIPQRKKDNQ